MEKDVLKALIAQHLDDIAKIAAVLSTQIDKTGENVGAIQFLLLQYIEAFDRAKKYGGNPNLSIQANFERRGIKHPNIERDVNATLQHYAKVRVNDPSYSYDGKSIFGDNFLPEIYLPTSIDVPQFQVPLVNAARLIYADGGLQELEKGREALQSGLVTLSDPGKKLYDQIIDTAKSDEFGSALATAYLQNFGLEKSVEKQGDDLVYKLIKKYIEKTYSYRQGSWNNCTGSFDEEEVESYEEKKSEEFSRKF